MVHARQGRRDAGRQFGRRYPMPGPSSSEGCGAMPTVPELTPPGPAPRPGPAVRFDAPYAQNFAPRRCADGAGRRRGQRRGPRIAADTQAQTNELRVIDALNRVRRRSST